MSQSSPTRSPSRRVISLTTAAVLVASGLVYTYVETERRGDREVAAAKPGVFDQVPVDRRPLPADGGTWRAPVKSGWPAAGAANVTVTSTSGRSTRAMAGGLPVTVSAVPGRPAPRQVRVTVLSEQHSQRLGVSGPVVTVAGDEGSVDAAFDYAGLRDLYGGGWGERLTLVQLPSCAATTPDAEQCQQTTPVEVAKQPAASTMSAKVDTAAPRLAVLAMTADTESGEGDYKATDLQPSGSWTAGDSSGGFTYSNEVRLPPAAGPVPQIALNYSSQAVDGRMAGSNNQASWVGDGWDYAPGFIERSYVTCTDDREKQDGDEPNNKDKKTNDQCWKEQSPNITVSLNGTNTSLVRDDATGVWRAQQDPNWKIALEGEPASKNEASTERWVITTPDGTRYHFAAEAATANSRWTVPVFGNHKGEHCHAGAFKESSCRQAWRWMLDKAVDVHGNLARYHYTVETGHYGAADDKKNRVSFHRGGHLTDIEYGLHTAHPAVPATAKVVFSVADRCLEKECYKDDKPVKANWPDVPWDRECADDPCTDKLAPVFFSTKRLTKVTTRVREGASFSDVESWTLNHEFKEPKAKGSASLWLKEIVHAGHQGGTVSEPPVRFTGVELVNRVSVLAGAPIFSRWRIQNIRTESGADIHVTYSDPDCGTNDVPAPENNSRLCYPVWWTPDGYFDPKLDWFRKYVVTSVSEIDRTADQPAVVKRYEYSTDDGGTDVLWAFDDSEFTKKKHRTYGQWRGYARVTTVVGEAGSPNALRTRKQFYRGLDDQPLPKNQTRNVQVLDSEGNAYPDHPTLAGMGLEEVTLDGKTVVEAKTTRYWTRQTAVRSRTGGTDRAFLTGPSVQQTRKLLAPGTWARTQTETTYNDDGQPTSVSDLGDTAKTGDETCTRTTYTTNDTVWLRDTVSRVEKVARKCAETPARPADVISDVKSFYDRSETHGTPPTKGLVTREDTLDSWTTGPHYTITARRSHDGLGREISSTDALGKVTGTTFTPAGPGPVTRTVTKNPLGHETITDQNPAWAEPTAIEDANKKHTKLAHDPLGRLAKVWLPGRDPERDSPNMEFGYLIRDDGPLAVTTRRIGPNGGYITEVGLFDSLYRSVQRQEDAIGGTRLVESTGYNDKGQKRYTGGPNHAKGAPGNALLQITPGEDRARTVSDYDAVGRVVAETLWSYNKELWATTTAYGGSKKGWQTAVTPPAGKTATATVTDVAGKTIELRQFHGGTPTGDADTTTYTYTPRGDVATVTNSSGRTWTYEYDLRGREVTTKDPDKGTTVLTYNNDDDVLTSTDAEGEVVATEYDDLGRQSKRFFNGKLAAEWIYDSVAAGHLTSSTSIVDGHRFVRNVLRYNDAYQVNSEQVIIPAMPGLEGIAGSFSTGTTYNVDGSVARRSVPKVGSLERETLGYVYDDLGNVTWLGGTSDTSGTLRVYVEKADYSPYGEVLTRRLGDKEKPQAHQTYVYDDATRRLAEFYFDRDATVPNVAALKYSYDDAGNVLSMANRPVDKDEKPRPGVSDVQCFGYDHLRRLTRAWSQGTDTCAQTPTAEVVGGIAPYWKSWVFDEAGSRTSTTDHGSGLTSTYTYPQTADASQPHAVRTVTTGSRVDHYDWDKTGNLTYRKVDGVTETLDWSPHGKLTEITGPGGKTRMIYDVDGNRIARLDPDGTTTAFVAGQEYTAKGKVKTATRYYEHAGDTVASRTVSSAGGTGDIIWLGADQHDSVTWAVNAVTRVETIKYADPYGNPRTGGSGGAWPAGQRGFVGGVSDPTGLTMLGARYYDPTLGAFISVDPETDEYDPQRLHPFAYANNNPVTFADPDGLFWGAVKNAAAKAGNAVASAATSAAKAVVNNAGTIAAVAGTVAMVAAVLPPPAQVVAAAAGAVAAVAGAIDTIKTCAGGDAMNCAQGVAGMVPGVRQAKTAARGAGALKNAAKDRAKRSEADSCPLPGNSFLAGTLVLMADGTYKPIEDIVKDDVVWAFDPETGGEGARPVTALIPGSGPKRLVDVVVDDDADGEPDGMVTATDEHPFWVDDLRAWVPAEQLRAGQSLLTPDGARVTVLAVLAYDAVAEVYNFSVDDLNTYFVFLGGAPVLVHNRLPDEDRVLVYHYTDKRGYNGIRGGNPHVIRSGNSKHGRGPFVTPLGPRSLKPKDYKAKLGLTRAKSEFVMKFWVDRAKLGQIKGDRGQHVWTLPGDTNVDRKDVEYFGPTTGCP